MPTKPRIAGFGHVHLPAKNLDRQRTFYTENFGLNVLVDEVDFLMLGYDGGNISFGRVPRVPQETVNVHFGFRVDDPAELERWEVFLKTRGVDLLSGTTDVTSDHVQGRTLVCRDPEGYAVELSYEVEE